MQDHLNAARAAAEMTDMQLINAWAQVVDPENLTCEEQAILDEMARRDIDF